MDHSAISPSTSAIDKWSDRAIRVVHWEAALAFNLALFWSAYPLNTPGFEYSHSTLTKTKLFVIILTIFLPFASCVTSLKLSFTSLYASGRAPIKPLLYTSFQILQLTACSYISVHDLVIFSTTSIWLWFSLVGGFVPAFAGTIYGLVGITRFCFTGSPQLSLQHYRSSTASIEYSDDTDDHCALEQAYQQQAQYVTTNLNTNAVPDTVEHQANGDGILLQQLSQTETTYTQSRNAQEPGNHVTAQAPSSSWTLNRGHQARLWHAASPSTTPRFRWQEQTGARNGGTMVWGPMSTIVGLTCAWTIYYRFLSHRDYYSPELERLLVLQAVAPVVISFLSNTFLMLSLRRPYLTWIFTAFCFSVLASIAWSAEFFYSTWCFFYYMRQQPLEFNVMSFALILMSVGMTWSHVALLRCSVKMEWTPGYSSLAKEYVLWTERRNEARVAMVVDGDEEA